MQIKTRLTESDFVKVNFVLLLKRPGLKIAVGIILLLMIYSAYLQITYEKGVYLDMFIWPLILLIVLPLLTYIGARVNYKSNARIKETIEYQFENDYLVVNGESFTSRLTWQKIYKVTKTKDWLLIWQSRQVANVIPLRDVWEGDMEKLKEILDSHAVKNNL